MRAMCRVFELSTSGYYAWRSRGHSQRAQLNKRLTEQFKAFLADREFIGKEWFRYLRDRDVPFCIRVRKDTTVAAGSGTCVPAYWLFKDLPVIGSADGRTETHGTIRALSKACRVFSRRAYIWWERAMQAVRGRRSACSS